MKQTSQQLEADADRLLNEKVEENILDRSDSETISCKIGGREKEAFKRLCEQKLGCTMNEALQMMVDVLRRYMEDRHNLSKEINEMISLFEGFKGWDAHINLADPIDRKTIVAAIYILAQGDKPNGRIPVMVEGAWNDLYQTETANVQHIFERMVEWLSPLRHDKLRLVMQRRHIDSMLAAFDHVVDEYDVTIDILEGTREEFERCNLADNGKVAIPDGGPNKRTMSNSMSDYERKLEAWNRTHPQLSLWTEEDQINETF